MTERGFTLIQVMVGVALMGIISLALAEIVVSLARVESRARAQFDLIDVMHDVEMALVRSAACRHSLASAPEIQNRSPGLSPELPLSLNGIYDENHQPIIKTNQEIGKTRLAVEAIRGSLDAQTPAWIPNQLLVLNVMVTMKGTNGFTLSGPEKMVRRFSLTIETGPNNEIAACSRIDMSEQRKLEKAVCDSLGGATLANGTCNLSQGVSLLKAICTAVGLNVSSTGGHCGL